MGNEHSQPDVKLPDIKFRVLIIGRANAGKTSILQRVCYTTDSLVIYRRTRDGKKEKVRDQRVFIIVASLPPLSPQIQLDPSMDVSDTRP
jgi:GTPase SAR1 family protein